MFIMYGTFCTGEGTVVSTLWLAFVTGRDVPALPVPPPGPERITRGQ